MDDADFLDGAPQFCHASMPCFNGEAGAIPKHELKNCEKLQLHLCEQPIYKANDDYMGEEGDSPKPSMSDYIVCTKLRLRFRYPERSVCTCSTERPSGKRVPK